MILSPSRSATRAVDARILSQHNGDDFGSVARSGEIRKHASPCTVPCSSTVAVVQPSTTVPLRIGAALVGAQKCGTTSLAAMLARHPRVRLAVGKEAHLFDTPRVQRDGPTKEDMDRFWPGATPGEVLLDATPSYLHLPGCLEALVHHNPEVRIIVILRSPATRAVSHYWHQRRLGTEKRSFLMAMFLEGRRLRRSVDPLHAESAQRHASYADRGRYRRHLSRLVSLTDRFRVVLFEDLLSDPAGVLADLHGFLEVEVLPSDDLEHLNAGDGKRRALTRCAARAWLRGESRRAERFLSLPRGALR
jgi:hypothetical protein